MSKFDKLLERIVSLSRDVRFEELRKVLEHYGYTMQAPHGGSSHCTFRKDGCKMITIPKHKQNRGWVCTNSISVFCLFLTKNGFQGWQRIFFVIKYHKTKKVNGDFLKFATVGAETSVRRAFRCHLFFGGEPFPFLRMFGFPLCWLSGKNICFLKGRLPTWKILTKICWAFLRTPRQWWVSPPTNT